MLTAEEVAELREVSGRITDSVNAYLIQDICARIAAAGQITATAAYRAYLAETLGTHFSKVKREISKHLKISAAQVDGLFAEAAKTSYNNEVRRLGVNHLTFEENGAVQQLVKAARELADVDFRNITQTLGMVDRRGRELPLKKYYNSVMDDVFNRVATGASDYNEAVRDACNALADRGVTSIGYESGVVTSLEAAIRRNVMGGLGLVTERISVYNHDSLDADGWEMSAHAMSAPDHEPYQGKQYTDEEWLDLNGTAEAPGLLKRRVGTLNCGHTASPVILGVNRRQYTDEELAKFASDNAAGIVYEGKRYTLYEATQEARRLERVIRKWRRREAAAKGSGDEQSLIRARARITNASRALSEFSQAAGLRLQHDRLFVVGKAQIDTGQTDYSVVGIKTSNGIAVSGLSDHAKSRLIERGINVENIKDALQKPLNVGKIKTDSKGRISQTFIGSKATVAINPDTGNIATAYPTSAQKREKYGGDKL